MSSSNPAPGGAPSGVYLLDTSVLIRSLRGDVGTYQRRYSDLCLECGARRTLLWRVSPSRSVPALIEVEQIERALTVLQIDAATAQIFGRIKQELKRAGLNMPDNDLWIAATAIQYDITLAARDAHFDWVAGLRVEQW